MVASWVKIVTGFTTNGSLKPLHRIKHTKGIAERLRPEEKNLDAWNKALALVGELEKRDFYTLGHSRRVMDLSVLIGERMNLPLERIARLKMAALLHDMGKIEVPDEVLLKPDKLTREEFEVMKWHPVVGYRILEWLGINDPALLEIILHHHDKLDGKGYHGAKAEEISLEARIIAVADAFDAMTTNRIYRNAPGLEYALAEFKKYSGTQFDPEVVRVFLGILEEGIEFHAPFAPSVERDTVADFRKFTNLRLLQEIEDVSDEMSAQTSSREAYLNEKFIRVRMPVFSGLFLGPEDKLFITLEQGASKEDARALFLTLMEGKSNGTSPFNGRLIRDGDRILLRAERGATSQEEQKLHTELCNYLLPMFHDIGNILTAIDGFRQVKILDKVLMPPEDRKELEACISRLMLNHVGLSKAVTNSMYQSDLNAEISRAQGWLPVLQEIKADFERIVEIMAGAQDGETRENAYLYSLEAIDIIDNYLKLMEGKEAQKRERMKLKDLLGKVGLGKEVILKVDPSLEIEVNLSMAKAVFRNLKGNADKAMEILSPQERRIEVEVKISGSSLLIEFRNTGHIPDEFLQVDPAAGRQRIFVPGVTSAANKVGKGQGGDIIYRFSMAQGAKEVFAQNRNGMAVITLVFPATLENMRFQIGSDLVMDGWLRALGLKGSKVHDPSILLAVLNLVDGNPYLRPYLREMLRTEENIIVRARLEEILGNGHQPEIKEEGPKKKKGDNGDEEEPQKPPISDRAKREGYYLPGSNGGQSDQVYLAKGGE